jgi:hypothetical protein
LRRALRCGLALRSLATPSAIVLRGDGEEPRALVTSLSSTYPK